VDGREDDTEHSGEFNNKDARTLPAGSRCATSGQVSPALTRAVSNEAQHGTYALPIIAVSFRCNRRSTSTTSRMFLQRYADNSEADCHANATLELFSRKPVVVCTAPSGAVHATNAAGRGRRGSAHAIEAPVIARQPSVALMRLTRSRERFFRTPQYTHATALSLPISLRRNAA
jgi:hypothetical protein